VSSPDETLRRYGASSLLPQVPAILPDGRSGNECSIQHALMDEAMIPCGTAALGCARHFAQPRAAVPHIKARRTEHSKVVFAPRTGGAQLLHTQKAPRTRGYGRLFEQPLGRRRSGAAAEVGCLFSAPPADSAEAEKRHHTSFPGGSARPPHQADRVFSLRPRLLHKETIVLQYDEP